MNHLTTQSCGKSPDIAHYGQMDELPDQYENAQRKEMMETAIARLDPEQRQVFLLREVDALTYRQIAETLKISESTVATRLRQARNRLKQLLNELGWEQ